MNEHATLMKQLLHKSYLDLERLFNKNDGKKTREKVGDKIDELTQLNKKYRYWNLDPKKYHAAVCKIYAKIRKSKKVVYITDDEGDESSDDGITEIVVEVI